MVDAEGISPMITIQLWYGYDMCVDLPPELGYLVRFRVSLGHKANHSNRFNAQFFSVHPAFGTIMAVVAPRQGGDLSLVQIHRDTVLCIYPTLPTYHT